MKKAMRVGIYYGYSKPNGFSLRRLAREARHLGMRPEFICGSEINVLVSSPRRFRFYLKHDRYVLPPVIISRLHATAKGINLLILSHIQRTKRTRVINKAFPISIARDKFRTMQSLASKGFRIPKSVLLGSSKDVEWAIDHVGGLPVILKLARGSLGKGVIIVNTIATARSVHDVVSGSGKVIVQEYISSEPGVDYRFYVLDNQLVASMRRSSKAKDEFRANFSLGGKVEKYNPPENVRKLVLSITRAIGLDVCGVDMIKTEKGFIPIEVNVNPGLKGIEKATNINIARKVMKYVKRQGEEFLAEHPRLRKQEQLTKSGKKAKSANLQPPSKPARKKS